MGGDLKDLPPGTIADEVRDSRHERSNPFRRDLTGAGARHGPSSEGSAHRVMLQCRETHLVLTSD